MLDVGQASLVGGVPRHDSPRTRIAAAPSAYAAFGDLYLVVQGGSDRMSQSFTDTLVSIYFSRETTSVIAGLMNGMRQAAQAVAVGAGPNEPLESVGATGAVITDTELYIAQLMPSQVYILRDARLNALPTTPGPADDTMLGPEPEIDLFRADLIDGDVVVLSSTDLRHELTDREIRGLLIDRSAQEAAHDLGALAAQRGGSASEVLVVRVGARPAAERSAAPTTRKSGFTRSPNGETGGDATVAPSVVIREPDWQDSASVQAAPDPGPDRAAPRAPRTLTQRLAALPLTLLMLVLLLPVLAVRAVTDRVSRGRRGRPPDGLATLERVPEDLSDDDWSSLRDLREAGPAGTRRIPAAGANSTLSVPPLDSVGLPLGRGRDPFLHRRRRTLPGPGTLLFGFALVLLLVMAVVLVLRNGGGDESTATGESGSPAEVATTERAGRTVTEPVAGASTSAAQTFAQAETRFREAIDRPPDENRAATLLILRDSKDLANRALSADADRTLAPDINRLLSQIGREEDRLNRVRKLVPSATIGEFETAGVGSAAGPLDVRLDSKFVIDAVSGRVVEFATAKQGATVLRKGDVVGSVTVQDPVAVVNRSLNVLVIDSRFNVFSLQPDQNPRLLRIAATDQWRTPVAFDNFNNNLYVLDPGANAILKYQWTAGGYEIGPANYLDPRDDVDISGAVDFAIDGDIWVLIADGRLLRLRGGRLIDFEISGLDADAARAAKIFTDVDTESLYLVDQANDRIVQIDKRDGSAGQFVRQFKYAGSDDFFADIRGLWVSELDGKLIVLGKDSLRQFVLPKIQDSEQTGG